MKRLSLLLPLLLSTCHSAPAYAETCTEKYAKLFEADVQRIEQGAASPSGQKIAINALARYYEDQWLICKQQENPDETLKHHGRNAGETLRPSRESASWR